MLVRAIVIEKAGPSGIADSRARVPLPYQRTVRRGFPSLRRDCRFSPSGHPSMRRQETAATRGERLRIVFISFLPFAPSSPVFSGVVSRGRSRLSTPPKEGSGEVLEWRVSNLPQAPSIGKRLSINAGGIASGGFVRMIHSKIPPDLPFSKGGTGSRDENRQSRKEGVIGPINQPGWFPSEHEHTSLNVLRHPHHGRRPLTAQAAHPIRMPSAV